MKRKKVLVAGDMGVVGFAATKHFSQLPGWDVVGVSRRSSQHSHGAEHISADLTDRNSCVELFSQMPDVTHLVYAAVYEKPGLIRGWYEHDQMETNLAMLQNLLEPLGEVATGLEHVTLMQGTKAYGIHHGPLEVPAKERNLRHQHENFYWLQEDYLREKQQNGAEWTWTIFRPQVIFGEALGSNMNPILALGVYAALQRHAGLQLDFPGSPGFLIEAADADLIARAMEWATTAPEARNQHFNITNGDVFVMGNVWPTLAEAFGMEVGCNKPMSLAEEMPKRQGEWENLVSELDLRAPADLMEYVGQSLVYTDYCLGVGGENLPPVLVSTIKLRQAGFHDCMDTEDMFRKWIAHFQQERLLPPVER